MKEEQPGSGRDGTPGVRSVGKTPRRRRFGLDSNPYGDVDKDTIDGKRGMDASSRHGRVHGESGSGLAAINGQGSVSELERGLAVANPGLFGSVLSVAKTPIRVAAGLMTKVRGEHCRNHKCRNEYMLQLGQPYGFNLCYDVNKDRVCVR